ncbi:MAG: argininosuccinate synthase [Candidatus Brocadiia bacterium]
MSPANRRKVVLAYNGGLSTSLCIDYLANEMNMDVIVYMADLGGRKNIQQAVAAAYKLGATQVHISDLRSFFIEKIAFKALRADAEIANGFFLARPMASIPIIRGLVNIALENGITCVAHGASISSNEQVRYDSLLASLAPEFECISPPRVWKWNTPEKMFAALENLLGKDSPYLDPERRFALDENIWGTTVYFGVLRDFWKEPSKEMFSITEDPTKAPRKGAEIEIGFASGQPVSLNGREMSPLALMEELAFIAAEHGVGRADLVSDGLLGIKLREVCEYPAAKVLFTAHRALNLITLSQKVLQHQEVMSLRYGELLMHGDWYTTLRDALDAYFDKTQEKVSGTVRLKLLMGNCTVAGRKSPNSLVLPPDRSHYDVLGASAVEGFSKVSGLVNRIEASRDRRTIDGDQEKPADK